MSAVRDYTSENERILMGNLGDILRDIENLHKEYRTWSRKYASAYDKFHAYFLINTYYSKTLSFLNDAKSQMKKVYKDAESAETRLHNRVRYCRDRTEILNLSMSAYRNAVSGGCLTVGSSQFIESVDREMSKVSSEIIIKLLETYSEDGKWESLINSDSLSDEEGVALAIIYFTLDDSDKEKFINSCFVKTDEFKEDFGTQIADAFAGQNRDSCYYWDIDKKKVEVLQKSMASISTMNYHYVNTSKAYVSGDVLKEMLSERDSLLQDVALFKSLSQMKGITSSYYGKNPEITLQRDGNREIILKYTDFGNASSVYSPLFTNVCKRTLSVSWPHDSDANDYRTTEELKKEFAVRYGMKCDIDAFAGPVADEITGQITDVVLEKGSEILAKKVTNKSFSKAIGFIPIAGDVVSLALDICEEYNELSEERQYAEYIIDTLELSNYTDFLELSCVYTEWSDPDLKSSVDINPGIGTQGKIDRYNKVATKKYDEISMHDVLYDPEPVGEALRKIRSNDIDMFNIIVRDYPEGP